ncbi:MAG: hypothetical protein HY814_08875 [Candidatus Riflebacteria bacterium]|nr:hypothetical protein [Candidatus Riflebacteria bacterium]
MPTEVREPLMQFGPPGLVHFSRAVNVFSIESRDTQLDVALAVDDGMRSAFVAAAATGAPPSRVPLAPVQFSGGNLTYAVLRVPHSVRQVGLLFADAAGNLVPELACTLDFEARMLAPLPPADGDELARRQSLVSGSRPEPERAASVEGQESWLSHGPKGALSLRHAVNLVHVSADRAEGVLDDGGVCEAVLCTFTEGDTRRVRLVRPTPKCPAWFSVPLPPRCQRVGFYFLGGKGSGAEQFSSVLDLARKSLGPARSEQLPELPSGTPRTICLGCRNEKATEDTVAVNTLPDDLQRLLRTQHSITWEFNSICRVCLERARAELSVWDRRDRNVQTVMRFLGVVTLVVKCYVGAMSFGFPHGRFTAHLLDGNLAFLGLFDLSVQQIDKVEGLVNMFGWAVVFSAVPFQRLATGWIRFFAGLGETNPISALVAAAIQLWLFYAAWSYGGAFRAPAYAPSGLEVFAWEQPILCGLLAALLRSLLAEAVEEAVTHFEEEWQRRSATVRRGDVLLGQFHRLLTCRDEPELFRVLREILQDSFAIAEYQIWFFNSEEKVFTPKIAFGCRLEDIQGLRVARGDPNFLGHAGMFNEVYGEHTLRERRDVRHAFRKPPLRSQLAGPVRVDGEIRAILNVGKFASGAYAEQDLEHFTTLVSILGVAMKNAEVFTAKEAELASSKEEVQKQILEKEFIKSVFGKYVSRALVEKILAEPKYAKLIAESAELTVIFTDLAGFTTISEELEDPTQVAELLNDYLTEMTRVIFDHFGTLDKYMGDGIMAFFGKPVEYPDHAQKACYAAIDMMHRLREIRSRIKTGRGVDLRVRMGINTGRVVVGNMGSKMAFGYTVIGDNVNLAARLEPANKEYGTCCLISETTYEQVRGLVLVRPIDRIRVKGRVRPIVVYELLERADTGVSPQKELLIGLYSRGLDAYLRRDFDEASGIFQRALDLDASDGPSAVMLARARAFLEDPPPPDWDGVFSIKVK